MDNADDIVVTSSEQSNAARDTQAEPAAAVEQPKPEAEKPKAEATEPAAEGDEGEEQQNDTGESADRDSGDAPAQKGRKRPSLQDRIDELTKARYDAEREREHWREMAMRHQQPTQPDPAPAAATETGEPTLESCDFDQGEYLRKWYSWRRAEEQKAEAAQKKQATFQERAEAFRAEHPDFDDVVRNPSLPIPPAVAELILETDDPAAVAYYLGKNPQEAAAIAQMTPAQIGRAIGRIEAKLSAPPAATETPRQPQPKTVSQAPPPVTTLTGAASVRKSYEDMTQEEYEQARREERQAKGLRP